MRGQSLIEQPFDNGALMLTGTGDFAATHTFDHRGLAQHVAPQPQAWKRRAWGLAVALADEGHFDWEDLRQALLVEQYSHGDDAWAACQRWLNALNRVMSAAGLVDVGAVAELSSWAERAAAREAG